MPFSLHKTPRGGLWHWLDIFWGDQAKAWLQAIVGRDDRFNTEKTSNMISLNSLVHAHWDNSQCAFRVVRVADDELSMDVSFHWLPLEGGKQTEQVDLIRNPYGNGAHEDYRQSAGENFKVFNHETEKLIESGSIFTITTTDKEKHPLPSKGLLDLLWVLKRLAAMQGEGEGEEEEEEDDVESDKDSPAVPSLPPSRSPVTSPPPMRCSENLSLRNPRSRSSSPLKELGSLSLADRHTGSLIEESD